MLQLTKNLELDRDVEHCFNAIQNSAQRNIQKYSQYRQLLEECRSLELPWKAKKKEIENFLKNNPNF